MNDLMKHYWKGYDNGYGIGFWHGVAVALSIVTAFTVIYYWAWL